MEGQQERFVQGPQQEGTLYQRVGGIPYFTALVERFYARVEADPALRPLYPEDLEPGKRNLAMFMVQPALLRKGTGTAAAADAAHALRHWTGGAGRVVPPHARVRAGVRGGAGGRDDAD